MRIVIENLAHDVSEDEIRQDLSPFAPVEKIALVKEGSMPAAVIEVDMTHAEAVALARRIDGRIHKGQRLRAWVPRWNG
jgi:RNA recognition motif. (a.k.a. RRM, RBD, or RNP domain)